ncbi:MAG: GNA1162 family protein [Desulfoplanes sp.]
MHTRSIIRSLLLLTSLIFLGACTHTGSGNRPTAILTTEAFKFFNGEYENTPQLRKHPPRSVAVAPFAKTDSSAWSIDLDSENPADIVRRGMYNHISSLPFRDMELFDTDTQLRNAGLDTPEKINQLLEKNPKKLQSILGVDALVTGEITHFDRIYAGIFSQIAVGCEVRMWDLSNGKLLWRADNVSRAAAGGISLNPIGLAMSAVASLWNLRAEAMLEQNDTLFREIVSSIELPESAIAFRDKAPDINLFTCLNAGHPFTAGQEVSFRMIGDPGNRAYVDLGAFQSGIELKPVSAEVKQALWAEIITEIQKQYLTTGHDLTPELTAAINNELVNREIYEGTDVVEPGREAYGLMPKGYLLTANGAQSSRLDAVHTVDIDSLAPTIPQGLKASSLDEKIELVWAALPEKDIADIEIWSSPTPNSGFSLMAKNETNQFMMTQRTNFVPEYVKIRAVDKAGNIGTFTKAISTVALPHPDIYTFAQPGPVLGGTISTPVFLRAAKGPFIVEQDLIVDKQGVLYAEPGTSMLFRPGTALIIQEGALFLYGQCDKPIILSPENPSAPAGSFKGIVMHGASRGLVTHTRIQRAETGIELVHSSPSITHTEIRASSQAGISLGDGAGPEISGCYIHANEGIGGLLIAGEGVYPKIHGNSFENNIPFQVQSFVPVQIDLSNNFWGSSQPSTDLFLGEGLLIDPVLTVKP